MLPPHGPRLAALEQVVLQDVAGHAGFHLPPTSERSRVTVTVVLTLCERRDEKDT